MDPIISVLYNPSSSGISDNNVSDLLIAIKKHGFQAKAISLHEPPRKILQKNETLLVVGGDGTLNTVINTLLREEGEPLPHLAVLPAGTANDFSVHLGDEKSYTLEQLLDSIAAKKSFKTDVGCVNGHYFVNVAGAGLLTDVAHSTSGNLKKKLGMLAYYLQAARNLPVYKPFSLELISGSYQQKMEVYLFLVLNSKTAGGLRHLAPKASLSDGKLDILVVKKSGSIPALATLFLKLLEGTHLDDPRTLYFQADKLEARGPHNLETVIDGEQGPPFPLSFSILPGKLHFYYVNPPMHGQEA